MFGDLMGKLQEMKQQMEDAKQRLAGRTATGEADNGRVKVVVTGNHKIREIEISEDLMQGDREELQELLIVALNKAMDQADEIHEQEMQGVAKFNFPGLDL